MTTIPEGAPGLPLGVSLEIEQIGDTKYVTICSRLHVTKRFDLPHCYSARGFSDTDILRDSDLWKYVRRYQ